MISITNEQLKAMEREREESRALGIVLSKLEPMTSEFQQRLFALNNPGNNARGVVTKCGRGGSQHLPKQ